MLGGESFVDVEEDFANDYCESAQEARGPRRFFFSSFLRFARDAPRPPQKVQAEMDAYDGEIEKITARQKGLKVVLYGRFGSQINLEE